MKKLKKIKEESDIIFNEGLYEEEMHGIERKKYHF
jgi:hypothetical protein